ncbi:MAG TPA: DMT family transporter [Acidimicrobiia bacterium]|nr:DMT family transporter [Acidimicrobiia bacterium]
MLWAAIALTLLSAFFVALGSVAQQREAVRVDESGVALFLALIRNPRWWAGWVGDTGGYIAQAGALALGSLLIVQPLMVTSLLFALPMSARWNRRRIAASELWWACVLIAAIGVFLVAGQPDTGVDVAPFSVWAPALIVLTVVVAGALVVVTTQTGRIRAVALAVGAGCCYGVTSATTKSAMSLLGDGLGPLLTGWETYVVVVAAISGFTMHQLSFQAGSLELSLPAITILDPIIAAALGITVLDETLRADGAEWALIGASLAAMVIGTIALARAGVPKPPIGTRPDRARSPPRSAG